MDVQVVERAGAVRPDGDDRLDAVLLAQERHQNARAGAERLGGGGVDAGLVFHVVAADELAARVAAAHQARPARHTEPDPLTDRAARLAQNQLAVVGHEHARRPGPGQRLEPLGHHPHDAAEVYAARYGDCKDKHTVLAGLLKAVGYETWPVLIHTSRKLDPEMLVIADERSAVALAGVMGGRDTEISGSTVNVLLESAHFQPASGWMLVKM